LGGAAQLLSLGGNECLAGLNCQLTARQIKTVSIMKSIALILFGILFAFNGYTTPPPAQWYGQSTREETMTSTKGIVLKGSDKLTSAARLSFCR
jgi:hypothetical protein